MFSKEVIVLNSVSGKISRGGNVYYSHDLNTFVNLEIMNKFL
jgi:hypothetical protein